MFAYGKCGKYFAVYIEFSKELGIKPFFEFYTCNGETILDMPYGQIIITPQKILAAETEGRHGDEKQDEQYSQAAACLAEDRS